MRGLECKAKPEHDVHMRLAWTVNHSRSGQKRPEAPMYVMASRGAVDNCQQSLEPT